MKTEKDKSLLLEQLRKTPIIQIACEKTGVGRATYYRWRKEDKDFARQADEAIFEGQLFINDISESQLISAIKDKNLQAIKFWLQHHHPTYTDKLEISGHLEHSTEALTPEQEKVVRQALKLASLHTDDEQEKSNDVTKNH